MSTRSDPLTSSKKIGQERRALALPRVDLNLTIRESGDAAISEEVKSAKHLAVGVAG